MAILDHRGNPIRTGELKEQQTSRVGQLHNEFATHPSRGLTPAKLARILEAAEQGDLQAQCDLFEDMEEKDAHIFAELSKRKRALLTLDWDIVPPRNPSAAEKQQAIALKEMIQDIPDFEDTLIDAADAIGKAYACLEIEWRMLGKEWLPKAITHRPQSWFRLDQATRTQLKLRDNSPDGADLQPFGWIVHTHKAKSGYITRGGLHRVLAWPYLFKNYSVRDLAEFLEIYGLPLRLGKYPPGAGPAEKATLLQAVVNIGHNAAGIIPEGMAIDFTEAAKGSHAPFQAMMDWCERSESKAILGGTLTSQADGKSSTNALGKVHNEVRHDLLISDCIQLGSTLTRDLVYPLLALNFGGIEDMRRCPRFLFDVRELEDVAAIISNADKLTDMGFSVPVSWLREKTRIPAPEGNEPVLMKRKPAAPAFDNDKAGDAKSAALRMRALGLAALGRALPAATTPDQAALDEWLASLTPEALQGLIEPAVLPVIDAIRAGDDPQQVLAMLAELYPDMDVTALQQQLARAIFVVQTLGRLDADQD